MDRRIDIGVAAAFALFGLFMIINATTIRLGLFKDPIGPRAFFYGCGAIMLIGGSITIWQRLRSWKTYPTHMIPEEGTSDDPNFPSSARRSFSIIGAIVVYALLLEPLGYLLATPLFIFVALRCVGQKNLLINAATALIFTITFYVIFAQLLGVRLGVGPLTNLFRDLGWIYL